MKILLFCLPRTRSSFLQDILSQHYKIPNLFEPYKFAEKLATKTMFISTANIGKLYKKAIIDISAELKNEPTGILKMFPCHTYNSYELLWKKDHNFTIQKEEILDLEKVHNISNYDKIFVLKRKNLTEGMASYWFANERGQFLFTKETQFFVQSYMPKTKINLDMPYKWLKVHYMDCRVMDYQLAWMTKNKIDFTELYYEDIPNYVETNFPNYETKYVETAYDYKNIIANYDLIDERIKRAKAEVDSDFEKIFEELLSK